MISTCLLVVGRGFGCRPGCQSAVVRMVFTVRGMGFDMIFFRGEVGACGEARNGRFWWRKMQQTTQFLGNIALLLVSPTMIAGNPRNYLDDKIEKP